MLRQQAEMPTQTDAATVPGGVVREFPGLRPHATHVQVVW
jgi:hypothetical protein